MYLLAWFLFRYFFGDDETRATATLRYHLFYSVPTFLGIVSMHYVFIQCVAKT